jgi:hypothetical protein
MKDAFRRRILVTLKPVMPPSLSLRLGEPPLCSSTGAGSGRNQEMLTLADDWVSKSSWK